MRGDNHVERLFSTAYDRDLNGEETRSFNDHLERCPACASAYRRYRERINALRALPEGRMPAPVHLPAGVPGAEPSGPLMRLRRGLPRIQVSAGWATGMAGATIAAMVVGIALLRGGGGTSVERPQSALAPPGGAGALRATAGAAGEPCGPAPSGAPRGDSTSVATAVSPELLRAALARFPNRVIVDAPGRPGQSLTLATTADRFTAGARILVIAELTSERPGSGAAGDQGGARAQVVTPCVTLNGASASAPGLAAPNGAGQTAPQAALPRSAFGGPPIAVATIVGSTPPGTVPIQEITIPSGLSPGTVLHLTAVVPGSATPPADSAGVPGPAPGPGDHPSVPRGGPASADAPAASGSPPAAAASPLTADLAITVG